jgi:hypothetical protein
MKEELAAVEKYMDLIIKFAVKWGKFRLRV